ncbi:MAG: hypothetical protein ACYDAO_09085 [Thermoplasmataceae archaeon]
MECVVEPDQRQKRSVYVTPPWKGDPYFVNLSIDVLSEIPVSVRGVLRLRIISRSSFIIVGFTIPNFLHGLRRSHNGGKTKAFMNQL